MPGLSRRIGMLAAAFVVVAGVSYRAFERARADRPLVPSPAARTAVVVELFTSEGCSSCPPADDVVRRFGLEQPIPNVLVLAISEHVDYWDRLGWRDPFSSAAFTSRQAEYQSQVFRGGDIYTPQVVVDGQWEGVGSEAGAVARAIARAALTPKAPVDLEASWPADAKTITVRVGASVPERMTMSERADLSIAVVEDGLTSNVTAGENRGHVLQHAAVARFMKVVGSLTPKDRAWATTVAVPVQAGWKRGNVRVIAFLQERYRRRVIGAAGTSLAVEAH